MIPSPQFPESLDSGETLYVVHDALRVKLSKDYLPGDTTLYIDDENSIMSKFPDSGILTLTEQCSDPSIRAISFYYPSKTDVTFEGIELLDGFTDVSKSKDITNVTLNVVAQHHNVLKDALIQMQQYLGIKNTTDEATLVGRISRLKQKAYKPKSWFSVNTQLGLYPLTVKFKNECFGFGSEATYLWTFGDSTTSTSGEAEITKVYSEPGKYTVSLKITNEYGEDTCTFTDLIFARAEAPHEAIIEFTEKPNQIITEGTFNGDGSILTPPKIRAKINDFIEFRIPSGVNPDTDRSYAGEELDDDDNPIDPIIAYTWSLGDDLKHANLSTTKASYSIGGQYDLLLRTTTEIGAFFITEYEASLEIIENRNLWLWTIDSGVATAHEYGLLSETFRTSKTLAVTANDGFLDGTLNETVAKKEFARNVGFAPRGSTSSGDQGSTMLYYASGGNVLADQDIKVIEYEGFSETYSTRTAIANRPWNWVGLNSPSKSYFVFGQGLTADVTNPSYQVKTTYNLSTFTPTNTTLSSSNYENGAGELMFHVTTDENDNDIPDYGYFAVYRSAWKDQSGYITRNDGVGDFFRIKSFYKTQGTVSEPFVNITKLSDITGTTKLEGQLVPLSTGLFFFNNSGNISAYNDSAKVWETGLAGSSSASFRSVQDSSVTGYDDSSNSLLATSDNERVAYLSFDYSNNAFIKFNGADLTFNNLGSRPIGDQWIIGVY
jgi:PKD repeat protein